MGHVLRKLRDERFLSACELARMADLSTSTVVEIERGEVEPQRRTVRKLARALDVDPRELSGWVL